MVLRGKKNKNCTPEERERGDVGDIWDHTAVAPVSKMIVSLIQGPSRDQETSDKLVEDFASRTNGKTPDFTTTDEHAPYKNSLVKVYGKEHRPRRRRRVGRKRKVRKYAPKGMVYATVKKTRRKGRIEKVDTELVFGTEEELNDRLNSSPASTSINTAFVERNNGTVRHFNSRKQRRTYSFSKQLTEHEAISWLTVTHYNFCWTPRTLRVEVARRLYEYRSPAMAQRITDHVWTVGELLTWQALPERGRPSG